MPGGEEDEMRCRDQGSGGRDFERKGRFEE